MNPAPFSIARAGARSIPFLSSSLCIVVVSASAVVWEKKSPASVSGCGADWGDEVSSARRPAPGGNENEPDKKAYERKDDERNDAAVTNADEANEEIEEIEERAQAARVRVLDGRGAAHRGRTHEPF